MPSSRANLEKLDNERPIPTIEAWKRDMMKRPKVPHLIEDLHPDAPGEFSVVSGRTGIGKTNLQLHMAFCLATGQPFFGMKCQKVGVSMIAFEGPEDNVFDRVQKVEQHYPDPEGRLHFTFLPMQSPASLFETVEVKLHNTPGCKVVILDAIRYLVPGEYLHPKDAAPFVQALKELLTTLELSAIIALPIGKPKSQGQLIDPTEVYNIKGATEWVDPAISVLLLEKQDKRHRSAIAVSASDGTIPLVLGFAKRRIAAKDRPTSINLAFDYESCNFTIVEPPPMGSGVLLQVDLDEVRSG